MIVTWKPFLLSAMYSTRRIIQPASRTCNHMTIDNEDDDDGDDNNDYRMDLKLKILILIKLYISEFHFWPSVQELFACI